jgi:hypothetical protein
VSKHNYCPPPELNMSIFGRHTTNNGKLFVTFYRCYAADCISDEEYNRLPPFVISLTYPEQTFRLNQTNFNQYVINDRNWMQINPRDTRQRGLLLSFKEVIVNDLDANVWPQQLQFLTYNASKVYKGFTTDSARPVDLAVENATASVMIIKSPVQQTFTRKIIKIDEIVSFFGGFLSLLIPLGELLTSNYNERIYQLKTGRNITFDDEEEEHDPPLSESFNILDSLKLTICGSCIKAKPLGTKT